MPSEWLDGEAPRDCRGCHHPSDPAGAEPGTAIDAVCTKCHYDGVFQVAQGAKPPEIEQGTFRHADHAGKAGSPAGACSTCHLPQPAALSDRMPIPAGSGLCVACHDPATGREPAATRAIRRFLARLNESPEMGPDGFRGFSHAEHFRDLPGGESGRWKDCLACHGDIVDPLMIDLGACRECHIAKDRSPRAFQTARSRPPAQAAGTFSHEPHLRQAAAGAGPLAARGCLHCHGPGGDGRDYSLDPRYDGCISGGCHADWEVRPGEDPNLRETDHAGIRTDGCQKCHDLGYRTDMKTNRPRLTISRSGALRFTGTDHRHPFITGERDEDCAACHVADLPALESQITGKPFRHDTHLPAVASSDDCKICHARVERTASPADIGTDEKTAVPLHDEAECAGCHKGTALEPVTEAASVEVPLFAHADHAKVRCTECHDGNVPAGVPDISLLPGVAGCTLCHGHERFPESTGGLSGEFVRNCSNCHVQGIPPRREALPGGRGDWIAGANGVQFHPENTPCGTCHEGSGSRVRPVPPPGLLAAGFFKGSGEEGGFHESSESRAIPAGSECLCCHWAGPPEANRIHGFGSIDEARRKIGERIEDFPGAGSSGR